MTVHNHGFNIPRSPAVCYEEKRERLPFPHGYLAILLSPEEQEEQRQVFIKQAFKRRYAHIKNEEHPRPKK